MAGTQSRSDATAVTPPLPSTRQSPAGLNMLASDRTITERVAVYCRVSSDEQAQAGTIQNQIEFARRYCELHQLDVVEFYCDEGVSGTVDPTGRPAGRQMIAGAKAGRFNVLLIYRIDRLSRSLWHLLNVYQFMQQWDVAIRSMTEPLDTSNPVGRFVFQLLGSIAELERETIHQRTELGMARALSEGRPPGNAPLGYMRDTIGHFVANPTEAPLVREIFGLAASGSPAGTIARILNAKGVTPISTTRGYRAPDKRPRDWSHTVVLQILRNALYWTGVYQYTKKNGTAFAVPVDPLVEAATALKAHQQIAQSNSQGKGVHRVYLLSGLTRCGECGKPWTGTGGSGRNRPYYRCQSVRLPKAERDCTMPQVRADLLDAHVWQDIKLIAENPGELADRVADKLSESVEEVEAARGELRAVMEQYERLAGERVSAMQSADRGEITREELSRYLKAGAGQVHELERLKAELAERLALRQVDEARVAGTEEVCRRLRDLVSEAEDDPHLRRELVRSLVRGATLRKGTDGSTVVDLEYLMAEPKLIGGFAATSITPGPLP